MRKLFYIVVVFLISFSLVQNVLAVGVSPGIIELHDLANNIVIDKSVFISRANPSQDDYYKVSVSGEGAPYIALSTTKLKLPKGEQQVSFPFQIKPVAAPNGTYKASLIFNGTTPDANTPTDQNGVSFLAGVTALVTFTISDKEVKRMEVLDIYNQETEVDQPYVFFFQLRNTGNVNAKPDRVVLTFFDRSDPTHIIQEVIQGDKIAFVEPQKTDKVIVKAESKVPEGKYDVEIKIFLDNNILFSKKFFTHILPKGTLQQKIEFQEFKLSKAAVSIGETVRFSGLAKNEGEVAIEPIFVLEVSKDGQVLDVKRSEKQLILKGESVSYPLSYVGEEKGEYTAKAFFEYGVRKTDPKQALFIVGSDYTLYYIIGGSVFVVLLLIMILVLKKKKKNVPTPTASSAMQPGAPIMSAPALAPNSAAPSVSVASPQPTAVPPIPAPLVAPQTPPMTPNQNTPKNP